MANIEAVLAWIDLEMTGLDPARDHILEIASLVTTDELDVLEEGPSLVIHQPENHLQLMREPVITMHRKNGLTDAVRSSKISLKEAETATLNFIKQYIPNSYSSPICGNSVWVDRKFLVEHMPKIDNYLHYRCLDVSTIKELAKRWVGEDFMKNAPTKDRSHRAMDDIRCSVEELKYYKDNLFSLPVSI